MTKDSNKTCFSCFNGMIFQETRNKKQETRNKKQDNSLVFSNTFRIFQEFFTGYFYYFFDGVLR